MKAAAANFLDRMADASARMSLRTGLPLLLLAFSLAMVFSLAGHYLWLEDRELESHALETMRQRATRVQFTLEAHLRHGHQENAWSELSALGAERGHRLAVLLDDGGAVVAASRGSLRGRSVQALFDRPQTSALIAEENRVRASMAGLVRMTGDRQTIAALFPVVLGTRAGELGARRVGLLYIEYGLGDERAERHEDLLYEAAWLAAMPLALALILWVYMHFVLSRRALRLAEAAREVEQGRLDARTNLAGADELAKVGRAMNGMLDALQQTQERLSKSEKRLSQALDAAHMVVWTFDVAALRLAFSARTKRDAAAAGVETLHYAEFLSGLHPDDRGSFEAALKGTEHSHEPVDLEYRIRSRDGRYRWYALRGNVQEADGDGRAVTLAGVAWDVTARREAEAQLALHREHLEELVAQRTAELNQAYKELETFSYSASHDLRAQLRTINGFGEILRGDYAERLDAQGRNYLDRIVRATRRMSQLVDDLLTLSHSSRSELRLETVDLSALVRELADDIRQNEPGRAVRIDVAPGVTAQADRNLMRIVLENLLGNAWKYSREREVAEIRFDRRETGGESAYCVSDNGAGFDMAQAAKIFEPFQRLHSQERFEGSGIGLATVARIIQRHGGRIWAEASAESGATFFFTLGSGVER